MVKVQVYSKRSAGRKSLRALENSFAKDTFCWDEHSSSSSRRYRFFFSVQQWWWLVDCLRMERAGVKQNHNKSEDGSAQTDSKPCTADVPQEHKNKYITGAGSSDLIDNCVYVWLSAVKVDHRFTFLHLSIFFGIIVFHFHASHRQTKGVSCLICAVE